MSGNMRNFFTILCSRCGKTKELPWGRCAECRGMLELRYHHKQRAPGRSWSEHRGIWRFGMLLPSEIGASHGEGGSPLLKLPRLAAEAGTAHLFLKEEGRNPTGSVHDRGSACIVTEANGAGPEPLAIWSPGASGVSLAAYAPLAGLAVRIVFPVFAAETDVNDARMLGATVRRQEYENDLAQERILTPGAEPFRLEGLKTLGFEIAEQLGGHWPSAIVYPSATGVGLAALWKAVLEMEELGLASGPRPKLIGVQAAGCAPIVRAFENGGNEVDACEAPRSLSRELRVAWPPAGEAALAAVRASGGAMLSVTDAEMLDGVASTARLEGVLLGLEGGACVAAIRHPLTYRLLDANATVVLVNTVAGRRSNAWASRLPPVGSEQDKLGGLITPR
jgi:threonine synthase